MRGWLDAKHIRNGKTNFIINRTLMARTGERAKQKGEHTLAASNSSGGELCGAYKPHDLYLQSPSEREKANRIRAIPFKFNKKNANIHIRCHFKMSQLFVWTTLLAQLSMRGWCVCARARVCITRFV